MAASRTPSIDAQSGQSENHFDKPTRKDPNAMGAVMSQVYSEYADAAEGFEADGHDCPVPRRFLNENY